MSVCSISGSPDNSKKRQSWLSAKADVFLLLSLFLLSFLSTENAKASDASLVLSWAKQQAFAKLYESELGDMQYCDDNNRWEIAFCSSQLKNAGNAPRIFIPKQSIVKQTAARTLPKAVIVLFHGLSDSPYFVRAIAQSFQSKNYLVITPLTPGHGKKIADKDMQDPMLQERWLSHVTDVMAFADTLGAPVFVGGFSAGATFATWYGLQNPEKVEGVLLFSGALELSDAAETMSRIWGIKAISTWLDGKYETMGVHPYKYPAIASYSALVLMDVIQEIRALLLASEIEGDIENEMRSEIAIEIEIPIFAAHSMADKITLFSGIENLTNRLGGEHVIFKIGGEYDVCHQDLPMSNIQLIGLEFDRTQVNQLERCATPKPNPLHQQMMFMAEVFVEQQIMEN